MKVAYAVNLSNGAMTRYTHLPFTQMGRFQGWTIGVDADGVATVGGATADGAPVQAEVRIDGLRFGADTLKRILRAYVEYRPGGDLELGLVPDEGQEATYRIAAAGDPIEKRRVRPGRGPKAVYWSAILRNVGGGALDVNAIQIQAEAISRRVG